jgi:hypothetical protein
MAPTATAALITRCQGGLVPERIQPARPAAGDRDRPTRRASKPACASARWERVSPADYDLALTFIAAARPGRDAAQGDGAGARRVIVLTARRREAMLSTPQQRVGHLSARSPERARIRVRDLRPHSVCTTVNG